MSLDRKRQTPARLLAASVLLSGTTSALAQVGPYCNPQIDRTRSLVVTDAALDEARFSFANTVDATLESLGIAPTAAGREDFVRTLVTSFNAAQLVNPVSGLRTPVDVRQAEAALDPAKLLDPADPRGLVPVGLFNRFDLVPEDFSNCGEHRIVYGFKAPDATTGPPSRFFLIFEARLDNASSQKTGFEGCRPVAEFWRDLSDEPNAAARAARLGEFYYDGVPGVAGPVVQARNYGGPLGQVRGNVFLNEQGFVKWALREWIVVNSGQPTPASFVPVTVKDNPLAEFYQDVNAAGTLDPALEAAERGVFHDRFEDTFLVRLLEPDVAFDNLTPGDPGYDPRLDPKAPGFDLGAYRIEILNRFGARFDNRFNEFQGVSQGSEDDPKDKAQTAGPNFLAGAAAALGGVVLSAGQKPPVEQVVDRAGAVTCGGCHEFSPNRQVGVVNGQAIVWPASATFVHITEDGDLSPALDDVFLPFREDRLREAVCTPQQAVVAAAGAAVASRVARQSRLERLVMSAKAEPDATRRAALAQEVVETVGELRQEEIQKPGFFVTNRRPH